MYQGTDKKTGDVKYIGITERDPEIRFGEHRRSKTERALLDYKVIAGETGYDRMEARRREQFYIDKYGLKNLLNKINSINRKDRARYNIKK